MINLRLRKQLNKEREESLNMIHERIINVLLYTTRELLTIAAQNIIDGNPTKLSQVDREFWANKKNITKKVRKWF